MKDRKRVTMKDLKKMICLVSERIDLIVVCFAKEKITGANMFFNRMRNSILRTDGWKLKPVKKLKK